MENGDRDLRIRDLEATIAAMRDSLERTSAEGDARVQDAVASGAAEAVELKATVQAMREQLEKAHHDHAAALQGAERLHRDEMRELQATVQALRERLEELSGG